MAMFARVRRIEARPEEIDALVKSFRERLERLPENPGRKGGYLLVDRNTGRGLTISLWESEAAMKASEDAAAQFAGQVTKETGTTADVFGRYEVALVL